jgi:hypothetical protein
MWQQASKLDEVHKTMWIKSVPCMQKYRTSFRIPWISRKTNSLYEPTRQRQIFHELSPAEPAVTLSPVLAQYAQR